MSSCLLQFIAGNKNAKIIKYLTNNLAMKLTKKNILRTFFYTKYCFDTSDLKKICFSLNLTQKTLMLKDIRRVAKLITKKMIALTISTKLSFSFFVSNITYFIINKNKIVKLLYHSCENSRLVCKFPSFKFFFLLKEYAKQIVIGFL